MEEKMHIVEFDKHCPVCKYKNLSEDEFPCSICLGIGYRLSTRRPKYFKEKREKK